RAPISASTASAKPSNSGAKVSRMYSTAVETHSRMGTRTSSTAGLQHRPAGGERRRDVAARVLLGRVPAVPVRAGQGGEDRALHDDATQPAGAVQDGDGLRASGSDGDDVAERGVGVDGGRRLHQVAVDALLGDAAFAQRLDDALGGQVAQHPALAVDDEDARET